MSVSPTAVQFAQRIAAVVGQWLAGGKRSTAVPHGHARTRGPHGFTGRLAALGLIGLGLLLPACRRADSNSAPLANSSTARRMNVVLIIMDATRVDRFGCFGGAGGLTPNVDALAARGTRFAQAFAHAPWTLPSVASLLTSTHPIVHQAGGRIGRFTALSPAVRTLPEVFKDSAYRTGAIINVMFLSEMFGMTRGFDHVDLSDSRNEQGRDAAHTTDAALQWIKSVGDAPYFAMVHYFDPHLLYDPPEEFRRRFAVGSAGQREFGSTREVMLLRSGRITLSTEDIRRLEGLYNGEIAYMDQEIGRLLAALDELSPRDRTLVAIVADHGEEFDDHGGFEHGHTLFDELLHVPLILAGADIPVGAQVAEPVGLVDVAPTLCEIAGLPVPPKFTGWSLVPTMQGIPLARRALLARGNMWGPELDTLRRSPYKLIRFGDAGLLFDVQVDPREQHNLLAEQMDVGSALDEELTVLLSDLQAQAAGGAAPVALTPEQRARLCALGYIDCGN